MAGTAGSGRVGNGAAWPDVGGVGLLLVFCYLPPGTSLVLQMKATLSFLSLAWFFLFSDCSPLFALRAAPDEL